MDDGVRDMKRSRGESGSAQLAILLVGMALIALTWLGTLNALRTERRAAVAHENVQLANKALLFETQVRRQLLAVEQTLRILESEWERDPAGFDLASWHRRARVLADLALYIYIADAQGIIRSSTRPDRVGVDISSQEAFQNRASVTLDDDGMFIGPPTHDPIARQWQIGLARRLDSKDGRFAGIIGLGYNTAVVATFFHLADLGSHGMVALVGAGHGRIYASAGAGGLESGGSIAGSPLFGAMLAAPDGFWTGASVPGGEVRMHALRRVVDRPFAVVLGVDPAQKLAPHYARQRVAWLFAGGTTLFLLIIMAVLTRELRAARQREAKLAQDRLALEGANAQQAAARELAEARSGQLDATLLGMSDGVAMVDADMRLVQWNSRFSDYTGVPADMLRVGVPMAELLRAQARRGEFGAVDVEAEVARRMAVLRAGSQMGVIERARPDGRFLELRRRSLPTGGFVTLYADITERKRAERALESARELAETAAADKSRFVAIVSHEIRTPLNTLLNALLLLNSGDLPPAQRGVLGVARQSGDALLSLLDDILEMSRADAGQLTLRPGIFALRPLLEGVLAIFHDQAATRGIFLRLEVSAGVPDRLYTDAGRLRQVLMNLVSNAMKYSQPGLIELKVTTLMAAGRTILRLGLCDSGPAIDPANRPRLFQPFSRLEQPNSPLKPGTGLGLVICQRLTALMGGQIGYVEAPENRNEFWIILPILPNPADEARTLRPASRRMLPRTRVLLVDDIVANRAIIATLLRREGHMVDVAGSGEAAVAAARQTPYDIVLMDVFMPGMNGLDATRALRGQAAAMPHCGMTVAMPHCATTAAMPILALTANTGEEDAARCIAAGMNDMLSKPVEISTLLAAIARYAWPGHPAPELARLDLDAGGSIFPGHGAPSTEASVMPALDEPRLTELRTNLAPSLLADLVDQCLKDLAVRLPVLKSAVAMGGSEQIEAEAHAMAGMAASYAMGALEFRLRRVILAARHENQAAAHEAAAGLDDDLARTDAALRSIFSSISA